jgi:hypothetical protein
MTEPSDRDLETRVSELATGFALGELGEEELRELYELLRDEQGQGARAAQVAWQTLNMVTDLRAEVSQGFQDTVRHRLAQDRSGRFRARLWQRLGFRAPSLEPVEAPTPSRPLRAVAWTVVAVVAAALLAGGLAIGLTHAAPVRVTVAALQGTAGIAGRQLIPHATVDDRPVVVQPGGQLTLAWPDGSSAIIAGCDRGGTQTPAEAVARAHGLELRQGQAWISARAGFSLALPDRACEALADDTTCAAEVLDHRGFVGVRRGSLRATGVREPLADNTGAGPSGVFSWLWEWDASSGTLSPGHAAPPDWRLSGEAFWSDTTDTATLAFAGAGGEVSGAPARPVVELACSPGLLVVSVGGRETQRLAMPGSPLLGFHLEVVQRDRHSLAVTLGELSLTIPVPEPLARYRLVAGGGATFKITAFYPLPDPRPPLPAPGW